MIRVNVEFNEIIARSRCTCPEGGQAQGWPRTSDALHSKNIRHKFAVVEQDCAPPQPDCIAFSPISPVFLRFRFCDCWSHLYLLHHLHMLLVFLSPHLYTSVLLLFLLFKSVLFQRSTFGVDISASMHSHIFAE